MSGPKQFCSFWLGDRMFGVAVERVQEVLRYMEMTPIPLAPRRIAGLINLRGRILTVIDLRRRFGMESERGSGMKIVLRDYDGEVCLLVDRIGVVVDVTDEQFEQIPDSLTGSARDLLQGAYKLDDQLMLALDTARAVTTAAHA